jgi:hypothetical protein
VNEILTQVKSVFAACHPPDLVMSTKTFFNMDVVDCLRVIAAHLEPDSSLSTKTDSLSWKFFLIDCLYANLASVICMMIISEAVRNQICNEGYLSAVYPHARHAMLCHLLHFPLMTMIFFLRSSMRRVQAQTTLNSARGGPGLL